eukprot:gb/GEZN01010213.1/.p1 GENE.gb/GEZN01010213.1/~~gb/GEZN01010213.1/.p1  ORF type:complete len:246 (+),score=10.84 gb/GEZN01010213.1/:220-957(+)
MAMTHRAAAEAASQLMPRIEALMNQPLADLAQDHGDATEPVRQPAAVAFGLMDLTGAVLTRVVCKFLRGVDVLSLAKTNKKAEGLFKLLGQENTRVEFSVRMREYERAILACPVVCLMGPLRYIGTLRHEDPCMNWIATIPSMDTAVAVPEQHGSDPEHLAWSVAIARAWTCNVAGHNEVVMTHHKDTPNSVYNQPRQELVLLCDFHYQCMGCAQLQLNEDDYENPPLAGSLNIVAHRDACTKLT